MVVPSDRHLVDSITHVVLAFMRSDVFNVDKTPLEFPLFTSVAEARQEFNANTKIMVAIGGWGDAGFEEAARDDSSRKRWAKQVKAMVDQTGADGVDIDWEYPGYVDGLSQHLLQRKTLLTSFEEEIATTINSFQILNGNGR